MRLHLLVLWLVALTLAVVSARRLEVDDEDRPGMVRVAAMADDGSDDKAEDEGAGSTEEEEEGSNENDEASTSKYSDNGYLNDIMTEKAFATLFPRAHRLYNYRALTLAASKLFNGAFLANASNTEENPDARKRELAAFLAHVAVETSDLQVVQRVRAGDDEDEEGGASTGAATGVDASSDQALYCDRTYASCGRGKSYHGRGPLLLQGNDMYARCSKAIGRRDLLVVNPDLLATDPELTWSCAIWYWMKDDGLGSLHDAAIDLSLGLPRTTALFKQGLECGAQALKKEGDGARVAKYKALAQTLMLAVNDSEVLSCTVNSAPTEVKKMDVADLPLAQLLSKDVFQSLFNDSIALYSYDMLLEAGLSYPEFAATADDDDANKAEVAAFLAHVSLRTNGLTLREDQTYVTYGDDVFCNSKKAECVDGRSYHGRGALMTEWNFVYDAMGTEFGTDLIKNPDELARKGDLAWKAGFYVWMTDRGEGRPHSYAGTPELLAQSTSILYGARLCGDSPTEKGGDEPVIEEYKRIAEALEMPEESKYLSDRTLTCRRLQYSSAVAKTSRVESILTEAQFAEAFPRADPYYSYRSFVEAARYYPRFANEEGDVYNQREIAAFLTHVAIATGNFTRREMPNAALYDEKAFCDSKIASCAPGKRYHGRGAFQIKWNYNYLKCGDFLGLDLLRNPDILRLDSTAAWRSALWFWMEQKPLSPLGSLHSVMHQHLDSPDSNFVVSTQIVAVAEQGSDRNECGSQRETERIDMFIQLCRLIGVRITDSPEKRKELQCQAQYDGPRASATASGSSKTPLRELISSSQFQLIVDPASSNRIYNYEAFIGAASVFPGFAGSANVNTSRREIAAFFAHSAFVTQNFSVAEDERAAAGCTDKPCYYGRGPLMIKEEANYTKLETAIQQPVVEQPDTVAGNADTAWLSAYFLWTANKVNGQNAHEYTFTDYGFPGSCKVLTPQLCEGSASTEDEETEEEESETPASSASGSGERRRLMRAAKGDDDVDPDSLDALIQHYKRICAVLEVEPEDVLSCQDAKFRKYDKSKETDSNGSPITKIMPKELYEELFPTADPLYSYHTFIDATKKFPKFVNDGPEVQNRYELASFLAQVAHGSGNFTYTQQAGANLFEPDAFCKKNVPAKCNPNERYHGRGPIQLSWNYNYDAYGKYLEVDLLNHPNWVATDSKIAWGSAVWFWMTTFNNDMGSIHDIFTRGTKEGGVYDYAYTTYLLIGSLECGEVPKSVEPEAQRVRYMKFFAEKLGVDPGPKLSCQSKEYTYPTRR
ncbi:hypothetical protein Poli38472_012178 [Pythium oligandrum]|uniref:Glycoside hydrolase family 19 catalytic domain-containing protein n=1 Tax=Pythium oligandrum TaxID=41045 RepID=A0A8K1CQZ3_PYTOL|nr:hypothetical protein Poli38472_012178 [Pythium oligandrum]|eukprot:TMW67062.1 hypothetical protein Poli38472_012178 [Pythium oligandrum]